MVFYRILFQRRLFSRNISFLCFLQYFRLAFENPIFDRFLSLYLLYIEEDVQKGSYSNQPMAFLAAFPPKTSDKNLEVVSLFKIA